MQRRHLLAHCALLGLGHAASLGHAQGKPIRLIVPFPAGGATDITARALAEPLGRALSTVVVVDNRGGAGGSIGMTELAKAAPDGLTLGIATLSTHGVNPAVYTKLPYDPQKDFSPVTELVKAPGVLVVHPSVPANTLAEFIKYVRANPAKLSFASPGNGTIGHLWGELFKSSTNTFMLHIPYRGSGPALNDVMAGQVVEPRDILFEVIDPARVLVEAVTVDASLVVRVGSAHLLSVPGVTLKLLGGARSLRDGVLPLTFSARADKSGAALPLAVGQPITVVATLNEKAKGFVLPAQAVVRNPNNEPVVWIKSGAERFIPQPVQFRPLDAQMVLVVQGLGADNRVVVLGAPLISQIR